jgi:hypothetical protein
MPASQRVATKPQMPTVPAWLLPSSISSVSLLGSSTRLIRVFSNQENIAVVQFA